MPILIKNYTWRQTEDLVIVRVPLHNIPHTKVDLFTSESYIKAHYPPYFFEICLYDKIDEDESKCTLVEGESVFTLLKQTKGDWPTLNKDVSKQDMIKIKKEAIDLAHAKATEKAKMRKEARTKRQKACVSEQVSLEGSVHKKIKELKEAAKEQAVTQVEEWKNKTTDNNFLPDPLTRAQQKLSNIKNAKVKENRSNNTPSNAKSIFTDSEVVRDGASTKQKEELIVEVPMRTPGTISTSFTYRAFPTPSRESKLPEENEWLKKMAEARRKTGFVAEDLRPEENDPQWLLDKGKSFHKVGNYFGAISAFSHALLTWTKIPELWVARSESQLAIGNYRRVLRDTSEALDLLKPHVSSNADLRFTSHANRAKALLELGKPAGALADLEEALEIRPFREDIHVMIDRAEADLARQREEEAKEQQKVKDKGSSTSEEKTEKEKQYIEPEDLAN